MMTIVDTIVIELRDIEEKYVLAILAAIQAYEKNAFDKHTAFYKQRISAGDLILNIVLVRSPKHACYDFIWEKCLNHLLAIYSYNEMAQGALTARNIDLTSHVILDFPTARHIARASRKHLAQAYGIMLGSENDSLPDVVKLAPESYVNTPLPLMLFHPTEMLRDFSNFDLVHTDSTLEKRTVQAFIHAAYIGDISYESYLMSALRKPVFEISLEDDVYLLSKWSNPNYFHSSSASDKPLRKGIQLCLNRIQQGK